MGVDEHFDSLDLLNNPENFLNISTDAMDNNSYTVCFSPPKRKDSMEFHDEVLEVFSPTVFQTVEIYTSSADFFDPAAEAPSNNSPQIPTENHNSEQLLSTFDLLEAEIALIARDYETENFEIKNRTTKKNFQTEENIILDQNCVNESNNRLPKKSIFDSKTVKIKKRTESSDRKLRSNRKEKIVVPKISRKSKSINSKDVKRPYRKNSCLLSTKNQVLSKCLPSPSKFSSSSHQKSTLNENFVTSPKNVNINSRSLEPTAETTTSSQNEDENNLSWLIDFNVSSIFKPDDSASKRTTDKKLESAKKPRFTYTELIEQALKEKGELTVSGIYSWISNHYPYYRPDDFKWKNSVRHNLSINPEFRKGKKASQGAGHYWTINNSISEYQPIQVNILQMENNKKISENLKPSLVLNIMNETENEILAVGMQREPENELEINIADINLQQAAEQALTECEKDVQYIDESRNDVEFQYLEDSTASNPVFTDNFLMNNITDDIDDFWKTFDRADDTAYSTLSPLLRHIGADSPIWEDDGFQNSICLGDEFFPELNSPYSLTTI